MKKLLKAKQILEVGMFFLGVEITPKYLQVAAAVSPLRTSHSACVAVLCQSALWSDSEHFWSHWFLQNETEESQQFTGHRLYSQISLLLGTILFYSCPFVQILHFHKRGNVSEYIESSRVYVSVSENCLHSLAFRRCVKVGTFLRLASVGLRSELLLAQLSAACVGWDVRLDSAPTAITGESPSDCSCLGQVRVGQEGIWPMVMVLFCY